MIRETAAPPGRQPLDCGSLLPLSRGTQPAACGAELRREEFAPRRTQQAATSTKRQQAAAVQGLALLGAFASFVCFVGGLVLRITAAAARV